MSAEVAAEPRKKNKELEVMVSAVRAETPDTVTLSLFTGNDRLDYKPGHFLTIDPHQFGALERFTAYLEDQKGKKEPPRAYSLSSAPHEKTLSFTVKEEQYVSGKTRYPPLLSPLLVRQLGAGFRMVVTGFQGPYTLPDDVESRCSHLVHVVAGSGAVPNFSIVKHALHQGLKLTHTFICSNRTFQDVLYREELEALEKAYPGKLRVVHTLTRETDATLFNDGVREGRVSLSLFKELIPDPSASLVFACGPGITPHERAAAKEKGLAPEPRFLESSIAALTELGIPGSRIRRESYG